MRKASVYGVGGSRDSTYSLWPIDMLSDCAVNAGMVGLALVFK